jgi:hypothetical protein
MKKHLLGKVFISHSSVDKPFVRRLAGRIEKEGFRVWLDERELVAGDLLGKKISEALAVARAVLVVASKASIKSNWLAFELNQTTSRMIKGECRLIPVVIDNKEKLPPEVGGLLYADFTSSFEFGIRAVITALENEVATLERAEREDALKHSFWKRVDVALTETFGSVSSCSVFGDYESIDYRATPLPIPFANRDETDVVYEAVSAYSSPAKPLTERWWSEYQEAIQRIPERLFLVVTERPVEFKVEENSGKPRLHVKVISGWRGKVGGYVVIADLSKLNWRSQCATLKKARTLLLNLAQNLVGPDGRISEP